SAAGERVGVYSHRGPAGWRRDSLSIVLRRLRQEREDGCEGAIRDRGARPGTAVSGVGGGAWVSAGVCFSCGSGCIAAGDFASARRRRRDAEPPASRTGNGRQWKAGSGSGGEGAERDARGQHSFRWLWGDRSAGG